MPNDQPTAMVSITQIILLDEDAVRYHLREILLAIGGDKYLSSNVKILLADNLVDGTAFT
jgi:hypothetical protein